MQIINFFEKVARITLGLNSYIYFGGLVWYFKSHSNFEIYLILTLAISFLFLSFRASFQLSFLQYFLIGIYTFSGCLYFLLELLLNSNLYSEFPYIILKVIPMISVIFLLYRKKMLHIRK